jgi:uncharacterized protein YfaS (alpha-2-macroglobulin family)
MTNSYLSKTLIASLLLIAFLFSYCKSTRKNGTNMPDKTFTGDIPSQWKAIDSLDQLGLFKSSLVRVEQIYAKAKADKNTEQTIKALIFKGKYTTMLEEDGLVKAIYAMEADMKTAAQPEKAVLQSMLGELYATYLGSQGWNLTNRTPIPDGEGGDIMTWSAAQMEKHVIDLYSASVANENYLKTIPIERYSEIILLNEEDKQTKQVRSNLFDFLGHRAVDYLSNERSFLTEPAYKFQLSDEKLFATAADFSKLSITTKDSTSGKWLAMGLYQKLIAAHLNDSDPSALVDVDLKRIDFLRYNSVVENKTKLAVQCLEASMKKYPNNAVQAEYAANLALVYNELSYQNANEPNDYFQKVAVMCDDMIKKYPNTRGAQLCAIQLNQVRQKSLNTSIENANLPEKPILLHLNYRNIDKVWIKVMHNPKGINVMNQIEWEKIPAYLNSLEVVQTKNFNLPDLKDYKNHSTEVGLDGLPLGAWVVMSSDNAEFSNTKGQVTYSLFDVTNLAAISIANSGKSSFLIAHRNTGAPLSGVKGDFYKQIYNYTTNKADMVYAMSAISDANGLMEPKSPTVNENYFGCFSLGNDTLWSGNFYSYEQPQPQLNNEIQFFTDRSMYRPGQQLFFKGIVFQRNEKSIPMILPKTTVTVRLYDANGQEKGTQTFTTNEYGSINGVFNLPSGGLTGQMRLEAEGAIGATYFNVEEYKRPKFEVTFKEVEGEYRLNDKVSVIGEAKNFAGVSVSNAVVKYRVERAVRFPYFSYYRWSRPMPWNTSAQQMTFGEVKTDADGKFTIDFTALADPTIPKKDQPVFDFVVYADVTDITGEVRSGTKEIKAGYQSLEINLDLKENIDLDSLKKVGITSLNLSGKNTAAKGEITFQCLVEPKKVFNQRYWEIPDQWLMSEAEYRTKFPDYAFKDEESPEKWNRQDFTQTFKFDTEKDKTVDLNQGKIQTGTYVVTLKSVDKFGETVELKKYVRVYDANSNASRFDRPSVEAEKVVCLPSEKARIWLGSKFDASNYYVITDRVGQNVEARWLKVAGAQKLEYAIQESDRGGFTVQTILVKNNRAYLQSAYINVPWDNKDLKITFETFRDRLAPGQDEEWRLKISGAKKDKVAAELLASMYDASLDQFQGHDWTKIGYPEHYTNINIFTSHFEMSYGQNISLNAGEELIYPIRNYPQFNWFGFPMYGNQVWASGAVSAYGGVEVMKKGSKMRNAEFEMDMNAAPAPVAVAPQMEMMLNEEAAKAVALTQTSGSPGKSASPPSPIRKNLKETVFFFPDIKTDADGNILIKFKMNEALTRWKFMVFAHTKDLQTALVTKEIVTQKELMILANPPRFVREGDEMEFSAKVSNLSQQDITGIATLNLLDAVTLKTLETDFGLTNEARKANFSIKPGQSQQVTWKIKVPAGNINGLTWQIFADGKQFRDGEESTIPVLTNRMLVTETLPITVRGNQNKTFSFDNFKNNKSSSLTTKNFALEFSSNPVWYAVQALPYLMEYPHECSEQIFSRFYANSLAASVTDKQPAIKRVMEKWKGTDAMKSNLSKNQELKSALLEETPWVLEAQNEEQQKQNIALLFDLNRLAAEREKAISTLAERQLPNGAWPWFAGGRDDWYITQYILEGMGHLIKLGAIDVQKDAVLNEMLTKAQTYCNGKITEQYREIEKNVKLGKDKWENDHLDNLIIHGLYARSFFGYADVLDPQIAAYFLDQSEKYWLSKGQYQEGLLALSLHRAGRREAAQKISRSLKERSILKEELGMYWLFDAGYYWYQMPIETQALMIEVFSEVADDKKAVEELRIWLLKNKQTNRWESTKATSEAIYALLLNGDNWLNNTKSVNVSVAGKSITPQEVEAGTGYFKQQWSGAEVKPSWSEIKVENPNSNIVWGAAYWQYFEDLDKINSFKKTPLTIVKQLFKEENSEKGVVLKAITAQTPLKVGDRVKVRIEIRVDRAMEYVHLKDMRAAGFEPVNVLSQYKYQGGLGYFENTKDLATNFFIDYLPRGTFVFEYPMFATQNGNFSNGITSMQCMYAPEFATHSEGIRVKIEK